MNSAEIITAIRLYLGQPVIGADSYSPAPLADCYARVDLTRLAMLTRSLKWEASQVGTIPQGYPAGVNLVMKVIHRLLPWYTRPIQCFSRRCAEQFEEITHQIGALANVQSELLARIKEIEAKQETSGTFEQSSSVPFSARQDDISRYAMSLTGSQ